jgi:hypothetical protein
MRLHIFAGLGTLVLLAGCVASQPRYNARRRQAPAPCTPVVAPIRNSRLTVVINYNYAYNAKDPAAGRTWHKSDILDYLNQLGRADGNTFAEPNGESVNFYLNYTLNNDGQEHFTGSVSLSGWGQGNITNQYSGQYPYASTAKLTSDLTDKVYAFIRGGWHDSRPNCPH